MSSTVMEQIASYSIPQSFSPSFQTSRKLSRTELQKIGFSLASIKRQLQLVSSSSEKVQFKFRLRTNVQALLEVQKTEDVNVEKKMFGKKYQVRLVGNEWSEPKMQDFVSKMVESRFF